MQPRGRISSIFALVLIIVGACSPATSSANAPQFTSFASKLFAGQTDRQSDLTATVWLSDPVVPVLAYHQFQEHGVSGPTDVRIDDFQRELQDLYQAGYVMVPLQSWLQGDLRVPAGKRPIIFTMDDLFYHNQIEFSANGTISPTTGLGASYAFSQSHPDFGFHWALFVNMGDHPYTTPANPGPLEQAIVWCMEHAALLYNHTYTHAELSRTSAAGITWELSANDKALNQMLIRAGRSDLTSLLGNIFALPFGKWPHDPQGMSAIMGYTNPQGVPMQAIMDIDFIYRPRYLPAPYSPQFNRWDVMRMVATTGAVNYFVQHAASVPVAQSCELGSVTAAQQNDAAYLSSHIQGAIQSGACPAGIYATGRFVFRASASAVNVIYPSGASG